MFSNGLRSHGIIEESEEIRMDKESIVLGSGDLYCTDFQGTNEAIPDDTAVSYTHLDVYKRQNYKCL